MRHWLSIVVLLGISASLFANRVERSLDLNWRFRKGDVVGGSAVGLEDHGWTKVRLPHTWNVADGADGGSYYRGPGWYRLHLTITKKEARRFLFLRFGAASLVAKVWVNGRDAGGHMGGFGAFCLPVSGLLREGWNLVSVRVDNSRNTDVPPLNGDFTVYGGLYRQVSLLELDDVSVSPLDDGSPGVYLTQTLAESDAAVGVRTVFRNDAGNTASVVLRTKIEDARGNEVVHSELPVQVPVGGGEATATLHLARPHLWDGVRDPYLYRVRAQVVRGGRVIDQVVQTLGLRSFQIDPRRGVILNGHPYDVHGVNLHQGRPSVGWAATAEMMDEDYRLVREMGCTGVRMAHYEHSPHELDLCDRLGLAVWAELAVVNQVSDTPAFRKNAAQQLRELIKQNQNHPSVFVWSLYNEPWIDKKRGEGEWRQMEQLALLGHELDPTRPETGAMNWGPNNWLAWVGGVAASNRYWGWYGGKPEQWPSGLDAMLRETGSRSFGISEYGAGASTQQHEEPPRQPAPASHWHPEEWQARLHEKVWPALEARPWIWCKFAWVMFDFGSDGRNEGDHAGINDKGLVTADRRILKDAFFYYKACWTQEPFVHILSRRFDPRPAGRTEVRVYSNLSAVSLTCDGSGLGTMRRQAPHVYSMSVELTPGVHKFEASALDARPDVVRWHVEKSVP